MEFQVEIIYAADVGKIANIAMSIPAQVEVTAKQGVYIVDAKSIMGLFSLDLSKPITICFESAYAVNYNYYKDLFNKWIR